MGAKLSKAAHTRYINVGKKKGYIRVWKTVIVRSEKYYQEYIVPHKAHKAGLNKAWARAKEDNQFIHAFRNEKSAKNWCFSHKCIVECLINPKWIVAIGDYYSLTEKRLLTLTTRAIVMPVYPKTKVTVKEFRDAIKNKKI